MYGNDFDNYPTFKWSTRAWVKLLAAATASFLFCSVNKQYYQSHKVLYLLIVKTGFSLRKKYSCSPNNTIQASFKEKHTVTKFVLYFHHISHCISDIKTCTTYMHLSFCVYIQTFQVCNF